MNNLSQEEINAKFHQMGVLLLLDAPQHLEFGIDNITWKVGTKFKGLKLIPLGTHVITYALKNENYMFPIKRFLYFGPFHKQIKDDERIRVFRWNQKYQRFVPLKGQQAQGYRQGVKKYHFDCYLGPYPQQNIQFWSTNIKYITKQVLDKLDPIQYYQNYQEQYSNNEANKIQEEGANIDSDSQGDNEDLAKEVQDLEIEETEEKPKDSKNKEEQNINEIKKNKDFGGNIYYSEIPRRLSLQSNHISQVNIDRTEVLESILKSEYPKNQFGILGELQYSFIAFLIGQCLDSYNQWKKLMILLSSSEKAFEIHKNLMLEFIIVFYEQIKQCPEDFFQNELAKDNFLTICIKNFKAYQDERQINKKALSRIQKLLTFVGEKFGYDPDDNVDEDPVVVLQSQNYF